MAIPETHQNLVTTGTPTELPVDPAASQLDDGVAPSVVVRQHPESSLGWAMLSEQALHEHHDEADVSAYAYARTGYHRGLDALRRAGWRGSGPIPWKHTPNRGFLRALWALAVAADRIAEAEEAARCAQFLRDSSEEAWQELSADLGGHPDHAGPTENQGQAQK